MYLIFDVTGIEKANDYKAPFSNTKAWPKLMHISWILLDVNLKPLEDYDYVVALEEGETYSDESLKYGKLDQEDIQKKAKPIEKILSDFNETMEKTEYVVAHNYLGNSNILAAEFLRNTVELKLFKKPSICIMQEGTYYCKIPSRRDGYKWPSLTELHAVCFQTTYTPPNNARADVIAAARCFIKMMKSGALEDFFEED
jgi:DNA polymerase III epsilon subunit-like protein